MVMLVFVVYEAIKGLIRFLRDLLGPQEPYKGLKGLIRPLRALQGPQGPYEASQGLWVLQ